MKKFITCFCKVASPCRLGLAFILTQGFGIILISFSLTQIAASDPAQSASHDLVGSHQPLSTQVIFRAPRSSIKQARSNSESVPVSELSFGLLDYQDVIDPAISSGNSVLHENANQSTPLSLAQGDFNGDGIADLVTGFDAGENGVITLRPGLSESLFPARADWFMNPIIPFGEPRRFSVPIPPVLMLTGDFNNDGLPDVVLSDGKTSSIILLHGDVNNTFGPVSFISLPGRPTAMLSADFGRKDGLADLALTTEIDGKVKLLLYQNPQGALNHPPEQLELDAPVAGMQAANINEDAYVDLVIATKRELIVLYGWNPIDSSSDATEPKKSVTSDNLQVGNLRLARERNSRHTSDLRFSPSAIAVGNFAGVPSYSQQVVLIGDTNEVVIYPYGLSPSPELHGRVEAIQGFQFPSTSKGVPTSLVPAQLNSDGMSELVAFDGKSNKLWISKGSENEILTRPEVFDLDSAPITVLPMRLNPTALDVLVVLQANGTLSFMTPPPGAVIAVDTLADDTTARGTVNGVISLREAILLSNGGTGGDGITTGLGRALTSGACPGPFETCYIFGSFGFGLADIILFDNTAFGPSGGTIRVSGPAARRNLPPIRDGATTIDDTVACPISVPNCSGIVPGPVTITASTGATDGLTIQTSLNVVRGLDITLFPGLGMDIDRGGFNKIEGCNIGVAGGNTGTGIDDIGSSDTIGGTTPAHRNIISGNLGSGIIARGPGIIIQGNYIGTDSSGSFALGNSLIGIQLVATATDATIGGTTAGMGNVISGNGNNGILNAANNGLIQGNLIGRDSTNTVDIPNGADGIGLTGRDNTVGGTADGADNAIRGNGLDGVHLAGTGNLIQGNDNSAANGFWIGGNGRHGIFVVSSGNFIGGSTAGAGNLIMANLLNGIRIENSNSTVVQGNTIQANIEDGIRIILNSNTNLIGGSAAEMANIIDSNGGAGVFVAAGTDNAILTNSILSNSSLGIDLSPAGETPNDLTDTDSGPNDLQNFPELTGVISNSSTRITGTLNSRANTTFTLQFFSNTSCDPTGYGEGETFIGSATTRTDTNGNASFVVDLPITIPGGQFITSTATDPTNSTSEFSACSIVIQCPTITLTAPPLPNAMVGVPYATTITASGGTAPHTFAVTSGTLPPSLALSSSGDISGTPSAAGSFPFTITATDAFGCSGSQAYTILVQSLIFDDFEDGVQSWDVIKGTWTESGGMLTGIGGGKATAFAPVPWVPSGGSDCTLCTIRVTGIVATPGSMIIINGWFVDDANKVEIIFKEKKDKVILRQRVGGSIVVKASGIAGLTSGVPFDAEVTFDGSNFEVLVNNSSILSVNAIGAPNGKVGFSVKNGTGAFGEIRVD